MPIRRLAIHRSLEVVVKTNRLFEELLRARVSRGFKVEDGIGSTNCIKANANLDARFFVCPYDALFSLCGSQGLPQGEFGELDQRFEHSLDAGELCVCEDRAIGMLLDELSVRLTAPGGTRNAIGRVKDIGLQDSTMECTTDLVSTVATTAKVRLKVRRGPKKMLKTRARHRVSQAVVFANRNIQHFASTHNGLHRIFVSKGE